MIERLTKLNNAHGPAGDEGDIAACISGLIAPYVDEIHTDVMGNLIAHKKGTGAKLMVCAHMDSIGFVVTHIEENGFLRVGQLGGISPAKSVFTPVRFKNGVAGHVIKEAKSEMGKLKTSDLLIDIGAKDRDEAKKRISLGDTAVFDLQPRKLNGSKVVSPYMDNRISCAILIEVIQQLAEVKELNNDVYFVFSSQEEVGLRGATTAAYAINPHYGIAVDVTSSDDEPGSDHSGTSVFGGGAAIKLMDRSVICHPKLVEQLEELAKAAEIKTQRDIITAGGTDAGAISKSRYGVISGGISIPCRYIHTPVETVDLDDVKACVDLIKLVATTHLEIK